MGLDSITSLISSTCFPSAMCIMLFFYIKDEQNNTKQVLNELRNSVDLLRVAIEALTRKEEEND